MALMRIGRNTVDEMGGEESLASRVAAYQRALEEHAQTEDVAAPVEHPLVVEIARLGGWSEVEVMEPPPVFRETPTGHRPQDPPPFLPRGVLSLADFQSTAMAIIDYAAELERQKYITPGYGQAMEYRETQQEALTWREGDPESDYPFLLAEVQAVKDALDQKVTMKMVVDEVLHQWRQWQEVGAGIKRLRRARKLRIGQLDNEEAIVKVLEEPWVKEELEP